MLTLMAPEEPVDPRAELALQEAVAILKAEAKHPETGKMVKIEKTSDRLAAARLLLDFLKTKPATKVQATVVRAEDFLEALVIDHIPEQIPG
jgi:hypothetical protein